LPLGYALSRSKYSDEQKNLAVEHYLNHDRCLAETRKALEYPCRDTLAAWVNELHPERRKSIVGKTAGVQHSPELKQAAVQLNCAPGRPVQGRCKKAGREQADAVQVEKSTTRPRGSCNHETQRRFTARF